VLDAPAIRKLAIVVGPMALSGSTRLQATTVLMLAAGIALLDDRAPGVAGRALDRLCRHLEAADAGGRLDALGGLVEAETAVYRAGDAVLTRPTPTRSPCSPTPPSGRRRSTSPRSRTPATSR
jgi:hypothetical protein